jgi:hypothetical protein
MKIDPSHNMRRFSDIPWGCWTCGACDCHHAAELEQPCKPDTRKTRRPGEA